MLQKIVCEILGAAMILGSLSSVSAQNRITYVPPTQEKKKTSTNESSATRGCQQDLRNVVTLIVPKNHKGLTTLPRPILFYHVSLEVESPALLTLAEIKGRSALIEEKISLKKTGINQFQLPQSTQLKLNQDYLWTITIFCNPKRPSESIEVKTLLERIPLAQKLADQRQDAKTYREKSQLSALSGLWYDTLFYLSQTPDRLNQSDFQGLLEQINLPMLFPIPLNSNQ